MLTDATKRFIASQDVKLNKRLKYDADELDRIVSTLMTYGMIEIGWRESCGTTDTTMYIHQAQERMGNQEWRILAEHRHNRSARLRRSYESVFYK